MEERFENTPVTRIAAAGAAAMLERLSASDRLEKGAVFVLSVEAIRDHSVERWARHRDEVWDYLDRKLEEHFSYQDLHQKISETDCLVAMTSEDGIAAQAVGLRVLEEVLEHFLGKAELVDVRIKAVAKIEGTDLSCTELDPFRIAKSRDEQGAASYRREVSTEDERQRNSVSFTATSGPRVQVDFALEPVVSLRHGVTAVLRVEPTVTYIGAGEVIPSRKFGHLSDEDMAAIDRAALAFGALYVPEDARSQPPIIVPVSFRTMGSRKGRQSLAAVQGVAPERMRQGVMLELADIDNGTPISRLVEVIGLMAPLCRGVLARLTPSRDVMTPVRGARLQGLTMDFADLDLPDDQLDKLMRMMAVQMRGKAPALIAQGLGDDRLLPLAHEAGFTHAAVRGVPMPSDVREVA